MSRFAVIDIPDYTLEEKKDHFLKICSAKDLAPHEPAQRGVYPDRRGS